MERDSRLLDKYDERISDERPTALDECCDRLRNVPHSVEHFPWITVFGSPMTKRRLPRVGKWLLFPTCETVADDWMAVASETANGRFWQAKVSLLNTSVAEGGHVICVYTPDFCNVEEVRATGIELWKLDLKLFHKRREMYYKPDEFTEDGIYSFGHGAGSIFALRSGSTYIRTTAGEELLQRRLRVKIYEAVSSLPVLPRGSSISRRK